MLHLFARLPLGFLYRVSDAVAFLLYRVLRVRRRVVLENLRGAFPEATPEETLRIAAGSSATSATSRSRA